VPLIAGSVCAHGDDARALREVLASDPPRRQLPVRLAALRRADLHRRPAGRTLTSPWRPAAPALRPFGWAVEREEAFAPRGAGDARARVGWRVRRDTTFNADPRVAFSAGGGWLGDCRSGGGADCDGNWEATHRCGEDGVHAKASDFRLRDERGHSLVVSLAPLIEAP
jgi:hypothetical protein